MRILLLAALLLPPGHAGAGAPVTVTVDAAAGRIPISPWIYGKNANLAATDKYMWSRDAELAVDAGLRISRETDGNNGTKYNWKNDLSSHPDWYNNVYKQGRENRAKVIQQKFPGITGLFAFPVLGWVAKTDTVNYDERKLDPTGAGKNDNRCGGGAGTTYLESQSPKEIVDVLDHWFGPGGLGLDPAHFPVWHMDNEPDIWRMTHDDISGTVMTGEDCVRKYAAVAREVKTRYPALKLMAPGFAAEWFWWNWSDHNCVNGKPWMEYFIMRMAEESRAFGRPLLDMIDIHTYANDHGPDAAVLDEHRLWYDPGYAAPGANGCKRFPDCGWNENQKVEMVFARIEGWLDQYFGKGHGIGIATTESAAHTKDPMVRALWYASHLGTFADHGVRVFTPWDWKEEMWEVLHLFSRYAGPVRVSASTTGEPLVSAYASASEDRKALTVFLVNRDTAEREVQMFLTHFGPPKGTATTLTLADLPGDQPTFKSHTENALVRGKAGYSRGRVKLAVRPRSITAVLFGSRSPD